MTKEELKEVADGVIVAWTDVVEDKTGDRKGYSRTAEPELIQNIVHMLRHQGWIVVSPSERDEAERQKWLGGRGVAE
jgi:hypothetical protein